jgi:hypothetical protein
MQRKNWKVVYKGMNERKIKGKCIYKGKIGKFYKKARK